ncbi:MAG: 16S rRNA (uracil(1498)-N(3))-methyltransferase [Candidatus Sericytochromatia bacterium]|nr:16S rRNA (uracil(1498)-N(3))-methyltransferase [Candidatus Sericytochromatia bacterium]
MHRFFVSPEVIRGDTIALRGPLAHQLSRVLRLSVGESVLVLDNQGGSFVSEIKGIFADWVELHIQRRIDCAPSFLNVVLCQAFPKGDKFEWIIQKATELGVRRIQPLLAARCVTRWVPERGGSKLQRWQSIATEAAEQCERSDIPSISEPVTLAEALRSSGRIRLVLAERSEGEPLQRLLPREPSYDGFDLFVGPEGGWTPTEMDTFRKAGCTMASLGPRILRTETAALAALAVLQSAYDWP